MHDMHRASQRTRFKELIEYKAKHGDCFVPDNYGPNKQLGTWVNTQRRQYRFLQQGKHSQMTEERINKLEEIGFKWDASHLKGKGKARGSN